MSKPLIGVMPLWDEGKKSIWMLPGYLEGIQEAGGTPVIFPLTEDREELEQLCSLCNGFLITGGQDVDPAIYGETPIPQMGEICTVLDQMERQVLEYAIKEDKAVLGICRGIQYLNAMLGGSLYQDLNVQHPSKTEHHMEPPYDRVIHQVQIIDGSPLHQLLQVTELGVNSYHHQAVKTLAPSLTVMAESEDGLVEAVYMPKKTYVWAVQWHPELSYQTDKYSRKIFESFVAACK